MRLLAGLFAALVAIAAASYVVFRAAPEVNPCEDRLLAESRSPSGTALADVVERRCGDSVSTHVALRQPGAPAKARREVFVAPGSPPVTLSWRDGPELVIDTAASRVLREETGWRDVRVRLRVR